MVKSLLALFSGLLITAAATAQVVNINVGTAISALSPINHAEPNSVYECIYLQNQVNQAGQITRLALDKVDGSDLSPLNNVLIYLKSTTATALTAGPVDSTGYQRVFRGAFTNSTATGYQEVVLNQPFTYTNIDNLSVLIIRTNGTTATGTGVRARYRYGTTTGRNSARRGYGATFPASLATTTFLSNIRLTFGGPTAARDRHNQLAAQLYPNPASDQLRVRLDQAATVRITDLAGRMVQPAAWLRPLNGVVIVPVHQLKSGVYVLQCTAADGKTSVQRFVRE